MHHDVDFYPEATNDYVMRAKGISDRWIDNATQDKRTQFVFLKKKYCLYLNVIKSHLNVIRENTLLQRSVSN